MRVVWRILSVCRVMFVVVAFIAAWSQHGEGDFGKLFNMLSGLFGGFAAFFTLWAYSTRKADREAREAIGWVFWQFLFWVGGVALALLCSAAVVSGGSSLGFWSDHWFYHGSEN